MARWIFVLGALCGVIGTLQGQTNYCTTSYCTGGRTNVGCNPPPLTGGPLCAGKNPAVIEMTPARQTLILNEHNTRRSQLASGQLSPFAPAKRMPTLAWDAELSKQAGNNARSCDYKHDQCRNTAVYSYAGQNLAISYFYGMTKTVETLITEGIASWWSEYKDTTQGQLDKYPSGYTGPAIGHFTQMASDQTNRIGCAMQYWKKDNKWETYYLVCDYALTNMIGSAVYKQGPVASNCTTGVNTSPGLGGLCKPTEVVKPVPN
ncbi:venom allergen 3-like [Anopheles coustani]|uniref:venom allergen 3-like n=1 Tax=Anopheles coustani TaxID=139045 RepID=UPI00265A19ED|nr:venom allergen 3-like [Anopheles coustani]